MNVDLFWFFEVSTKKMYFQFGLTYGDWRHFQQYFSYNVVVSFIGGGNQSTQKKIQTCCKSLTNLYLVSFFQL